MVKRRKPSKLISSESLLPPVARTIVPQTGKIEKLFRRLVDSGVDTAFEHFWIGVALVAITASTALWLYWRSGQALWLYPWLYFAGGFITACVFFITISSLLFWIKSKRARVLKDSKDLKFHSKDRGYLDHIVDRDRAFDELNAILELITAEILNVAKTSARGTAQIEAIRTRPSAQKLLRISSGVAERYERHSIEMENHLDRLRETVDRLIESSVGYLHWFTPNTEEQLQQLNKDRQAMETLRTVTEASLENISGFRQSQLSLMGQSQELNTAINRLVSVTDGISDTIKKAYRHWGEMIAIMDNKLGQNL
jgi:hypothetical protein